MTLADLGNLGDFISSIAIIVTLVYLTVQIRQGRSVLEENRRIALGQIYASRTADRLDDLRQNLSSPQIIEMMAEQDGISKEVALRRQFHLRTISRCDNVLYQHELGLIGRDDLDRVTTLVLGEYAMWKESGAEIMPRVEEWHRRHADT